MRFGASRILAGLALACAGLFVSTALRAQDKDKEGFVPLFNGKDLTGLKTFPEKGTDKTWTVQEGVLVCSGKPSGYFYTDRSYKNYVLVFDWKYARPKDLKEDEKFGGNSGILVHITGEHKTWPKCVEVQGMNRNHGQLLFLGVKGMDAQFKADALKKARKPVGEWNTTEITSTDGELVTKVNGTEVSRGKSELKEGPIGWQSEGAEIHFKDIKIKEMK